MFLDSALYICKHTQILILQDTYGCSNFYFLFQIVKFSLHCHKIRKNRFPKSELKKIPTKKYQKTDKYDTCPICLNEYEEGVKIRILPCEHGKQKIIFLIINNL